MIDYQLAKELKEAGFKSESFALINANTWQAPTLSELIEACGEEFHSLNHDPELYVTSTSPNGEWIAYGSRCVKVRGKTPEEAVAKLWLELNKKDV